MRDLPKDERQLDALIAYHLERVAGPVKAKIVLEALRKKDPEESLARRAG